MAGTISTSANGTIRSNDLDWSHTKQFGVFDLCVFHKHADETHAHYRCLDERNYGAAAHSTPSLVVGRKRNLLGLFPRLSIRLDHQAVTFHLDGRGQSPTEAPYYRPEFLVSLCPWEAAVDDPLAELGRLGRPW